ncbi:MAG: M23 family metallopeptidase [Sphingomonadales bacterium]|nr:M23 family metallopeptidase [Sphingomonadales bacterium]
MKCFKIHSCFSVFSVFLLCALVLSGCSSGEPVSYENIEPTYQVRNSPIPVPWPKAKPSFDVMLANTPITPRQPVIYNSNGSVNQTIVARTVTVQRGDTLYSISRILRVELKALIDANNLRAPYALAVGRVLSVPASLHHTVQRGETTYGISRRYGVDMTRLARANNLRAPFSLSLGQKLQIPSGVSRPSGVNRQDANTNITASRTPAALPPREGSKFIWPTHGSVLSSYGPKAGGIHNDGINIRAEHGAGVHAADAGVVAYAGQDIKGFGHLLLIRHDGGWVTAYAHNQEILVARGQQVRRGQKVANVGNTGGVETPQLHFEVRRGTRAVDPIRYLTRR